MLVMNKHLILLGFKHVGKSTVGAKLAVALGVRFYDLDSYLEQSYSTDFQRALSCRAILREHGEMFYRQREHATLVKILRYPAGVIALGGGTPIEQRNHPLLTAHQVIHITAPQGIVFERIAMHGRPAFFSATEDLFVTFNRLWQEREIVYKQLAHFSFANDGTILQMVQRIIQRLSLETVIHEL